MNYNPTYDKINRISKIFHKIMYFMVINQVVYILKKGINDSEESSFEFFNKSDYSTLSL
jgi:hypothetical protein